MKALKIAIHIIAAGLFVISLPVFARLPTPISHPIDVQENACREKAVDTVSIHGCVQQSIRDWDQELNKIYEKLMKKINVESKNDLKNSQKKWLIQRDAEFIFYQKYFDTWEGTLRIVSHAAVVRDFIKHRVQMLYQIYESDDFSGDDMSGYIFWEKI